MKFELKTEKEDFSSLFSNCFKIVSITVLIIILCDVAFKLRVISKNYKIEYNCRLLSIEKSKPYFKKLSRQTNLKSKQQIWEFCREVSK